MWGSGRVRLCAALGGLVVFLVSSENLGLAASTAWPKGPIGLRMECNGARFPIGTPLTGTDIPGETNPGDVVSVDLIAQAGAYRAVGYLYTTGEGATFVADRQIAQAQLWDYAVMNALVQSMSSFEGNAFDPRDNGFVAYRVTWNPVLARQMTLQLTRCPPRI